MLGIQVKTEQTRTFSGKWLRNRARSMVGVVGGGLGFGGESEESPPPDSTASTSTTSIVNSQLNVSQLNSTIRNTAISPRPRRFERSADSCPSSHLNTSTDSGGSPSPDTASSLPTPNSTTSNISRSRFSWRRKPLDLLRMVEGHFTLEDPEPQSPWEIIQMADSPSPYPETPELPLPDMTESSTILTDEHRRLLCLELPGRAVGYTWKLAYSTSKHGFSLHSLYREMGKVESPVLMVIQDTRGSIFGALTSSPIKTSDLFYGTGESFLFTFDPDFARFPWTGDNMYFVKGNQDSLVIGAGDGMFGLWLDEDLCHGRSQPCNTFANPRLSKEEDFVVKAIECWVFV